MGAEIRWAKGITPEQERRAFEILGETPEVKKKALTDLRSIIEEMDINSRIDDVFLLRFLRAKKYDVQKASQALVTYYKFLEKQDKLFSKKLPSEVKKFIDMNFTLVHPYLLPGGSTLGITLAGNFDVNYGTQQDMVSTLLTVGELTLEHEPIQIFGSTRVVDFKGFTTKHYLLFLTPSFMLLILNALQDVWPERLMEIHVVHEPILVHALAKIILPLLKKKLRERIHFHGDNLQSLHEYVPKEYLPEELGGTMGPFDCKEYADYFYSHEDLLKKANTFGLSKKM